MLYPLKRIIKYGAKNLYRQGSLTFATIFILVLTVYFLTLLLFLRGGMNYLVLSIQRKIDVSVYLKPDIEEKEIEELKDQLLSLEGVQEIEFVSADKALEEFKKRHKNDPVILESLKEIGINPLYPSLNIKAKEAKYYAAILAFLNQDKFKDIIQKVDYVRKKSLIEKINKIASNIKLIGLILTLFLGGITILIAFNSIRIAIKDSSQEIGVMRLVGASNWYIQGPFIVYAILCSLISTAIAFFLIYLTCYFSSPKVEFLTGGFSPFAWFGNNAFWIFWYQLGISVILAVFSSLIAIRRSLTV